MKGEDKTSKSEHKSVSVQSYVDQWVCVIIISNAFRHYCSGRTGLKNLKCKPHVSKFNKHGKAYVPHSHTGRRVKSLTRAEHISHARRPHLRRYAHESIPSTPAIVVDHELRYFVFQLNLYDLTKALQAILIVIDVHQ